MRFFVVAQPFESRVTKKAVVRPLSKTDLRHELWFKPTQLFHFFGGDAFAEMARAAARQIGKWAFLVRHGRIASRSFDADMAGLNPCRTLPAKSSFSPRNIRQESI